MPCAGCPGSDSGTSRCYAKLPLQIMPPKGYLADVHTTMRAHGALCVADEVQCGFGRAGTHFWAFDAQGVVPDIVTLGKSIGNGFPMGAVVCFATCYHDSLGSCWARCLTLGGATDDDFISSGADMHASCFFMPSRFQVVNVRWRGAAAQVTRREHAVAFSNGMEYFATCGGCTAAGAAGLAVMSVVASEGLQARPEYPTQARGAASVLTWRRANGRWVAWLFSQVMMARRRARRTRARTSWAAFARCRSASPSWGMCAAPAS